MGNFSDFFYADISRANLNIFLQFTNGKQFDAILTPLLKSFPEDLVYLLKNDGTLLANVIVSISLSNENFSMQSYFLFAA